MYLIWGGYPAWLPATIPKGNRSPVDCAVRILVLFLSITNPRNSKAAEVSLVWMAEPHPPSTLYHIPLLLQLLQLISNYQCKTLLRGTWKISYVLSEPTAVPKQNLVKVTSFNMQSHQLNCSACCIHLYSATLTFVLKFSPRTKFQKSSTPPPCMSFRATQNRLQWCNKYNGRFPSTSSRNCANREQMLRST